MRNPDNQPVASPGKQLRAWLDRRGIPFVLTLGIEALLVLAVLSLGISPSQPKPKPGSRLASFTVNPASEETKRPANKPAATKSPDLAAQQARSEPQQAAPSAAPEAVPSAASPPAFIPMPSSQIAGFNISRLPHQPAAPGPQRPVMGPAFAPLPGDSKRVGSAPGGQPLYAAAWYREPDDSELTGYLSTADGPGYALIACRTVPDWRVDDCVALDEYPAGSNIARAVLAAAWQFRVRPPRLGGVYKVGEWVRIRIDYGRRAGG